MNKLIKNIDVSVIDLNENVVSYLNGIDVELNKLECGYISSGNVEMFLLDFINLEKITNINRNTLNYGLLINNNKEFKNIFIDINE